MLIHYLKISLWNLSRNKVFSLINILVPAQILFVIALLTVSYRTYASARANPIQSLKKESWMRGES